MPAADHPPRHVLVVDDEAAILALLREALEDEGYAVTTALGPPATDEVARLRPNVIVLDHRLKAAESGWDVADRLAAHPATAAIPIVVCTAAVAEVGLRRHDLAARGIPVVLKPFDLDDLLAAVSRALADPPSPARPAPPPGSP